MSKKNKICIQRCFDLARLGTGKVSPNPIVGAILSTPDKIIGEGYHQEYGKSHAEVIAVQNSLFQNEKKLQNSTIFVSLEPCNIQGKTPPCTELIMDHNIPKVIVSAIDQTKGVNFSGIQRLIDNGQKVQYGILQSKGNFLARIRNTFVSRKRPYIILKYAQSADGYVSKKGEQTWLSNAFSKRLVHKWRSEVQAILVGTGTALIDNPRLNSRYYPGQSPIRITVDFQNKIPENAHLKNATIPTWIYTISNQAISTPDSNTQYKYLKQKQDLITQIRNDLYKEKHNTLLVEGGPSLLKSFIDADLWDEARIIQSSNSLHTGLIAPNLKGIEISKFSLDNDQIRLILSPNNVIYS